MIGKLHTLALIYQSCIEASAEMKYDRLCVWFKKLSLDKWWICPLVPYLQVIFIRHTPIYTHIHQIYIKHILMYADADDAIVSQ